ncbi:5'-nucleotidase C-terminal domain-containing protein [Hydrogenophaga sp.]|uniref:5'-nucleotidase C-terminal domain-containing protein n=1 Tax=Hydrogenophaga sp. TaxID=1904254 RepID=UPI0026355D21|nr:5'-nucleotidase C-terminal domain-containing protein [Hydrogenophaga sp.]MDM7948620.1 5'-nucleotidase C-terminal domain-containing protein [Hydrogenophaga sp.]
MFMIHKHWRHKVSVAAVSMALFSLSPQALWAETVTVLHIGDQESWLLSAQGNLRDSSAQAISFYGGVDRLATVVQGRKAAAAAAGRTVLTLNAGDSFLPGPRLTSSFVNLGTAAPDGGQDFYDAIASRSIGIDATTFGNHEFDLDNTGPVAARFADVSGSTYLSVNLDFSVTPELAALAATGKIGASKVFTTAGGKNVAVIGVTTPLLPSISSPPAGIMRNWSAGNSELQNLQALLPLIQAEIDDLRNNQGVGAVIVMSHLQNAANERNVMIPGLTGVDLVISGGGHELMTDSDDLLINGGVAPSFAAHPFIANDGSGRAVPLVTGHFGNRYVGEINLNLDDTTGAVTSVGDTRMIRVSGALADADRVDGDPALEAAVITPVSAFIAALNAELIGTSAVLLNGERGNTCSPTPCTFPTGVRNAETNLGNLVADAMRFAGGADVAIQNGGGVRVSVAAGSVTTGDTFNVLPFTNLVKTAPVMNATQLKDLLEHSVAASTAGGSAQGRFAQIAGMTVVYDTTRTARASAAVSSSVGTGDRVRRIVLDDGTVLVDNGAVVSPRTFSFATIDFTANGGDGYPFAFNNVVFNNTVNSITYQEALANFIKASKSIGGLQRISAVDGDEITPNMYGSENAFDRHGRLIDLAIAQPTPGLVINGTSRRDTLSGTAGDDVISGGPGADLLTGGAGGDQFRFTSLRDAGDTITDFTPYADKLDLTVVLAGLGIVGNGAATGHVRFVDTLGGAILEIDPDGSAGPAVPRPFVTLKGLTARQLQAGRDLVDPVALVQ